MFTTPCALLEITGVMHRGFEDDMHEKRAEKKCEVYV